MSFEGEVVYRGMCNYAKPTRQPSSATECAAMVRRGELSATELVCVALERIAQRDPAIGAVVELCADAALIRAAEIDRGPREGALCGVPITVKEAVHVAGMRSTWGVAAGADHVATEDAAGGPPPRAGSGDR